MSNNTNITPSAESIDNYDYDNDYGSVDESILSDAVTEQIGAMTSESEDEVSLHTLTNDILPDAAKQVLIPTDSDYLMPQQTESQFRIRMEAKQLFKKIKNFLPDQFQKSVNTFYTAYRRGISYDSFLNVLRIIYECIVWVIAFIIHILYQISSSWHLSLTLMHKYILTSDRFVNNYYNDRDKRKEKET